MGVKHWAGAAFLLLLAVTTKAHMIFIRLVVIAVAGLLGLYLLHVLASDYRKIQAARPKFLRFYKRSIDDQFGFDIDSKFSETHKQMEAIQSAKLVDPSISGLSVLGMAAALDPQGCARRYICTIAARSKETHSLLESSLLELIEDSNKDGALFREAVRLGRKLQNPKGCNASYPRCTFSITEMLRIIQPAY